ncbi:MAG: efflux RND transporter periplasmic adaptor subunit [Porticoccaceae bacterium]|jgi:RND family efflux transporter MFP subunit|nr:efflux transporter periplasmic adaptor subunit [Porticoccaceae bacterium]
MVRKLLVWPGLMAAFFTAALLAVHAQASAEASVLPDVELPSQANEVRLQVVPVTSTVISSAIAGEIAELSLHEGDRFSAGDTLIALDCTLHRARLAKARALVDESLKTYEVNKQLSDLRSISTLEIDVSAARLAAARAELGIMQAVVSKCEVNAPFNGRVGRLEVKRYQYVAEGEPMIEIIDDSALEVEMIVPSRWLPWLEKGMAFDFHVEETGTMYTATLERIGAQIDPVSQSIKVVGIIAGRPQELVAGMSGTAVFSPKE